MAFDRIMVWKFAAAPPHLRRLHAATPSPDWMVLIPSRIYHPDIEKAILENQTSIGISRYQTEEKDVIYVGNASAEQIPVLLFEDRVQSTSK